MSSSVKTPELPKNQNLPKAIIEFTKFTRSQVNIQKILLH
jgi:hypothetical protein